MLIVNKNNFYLYKPDVYTHRFKAFYKQTNESNFTA
jgi:hypothetical protein